MTVGEIGEGGQSAALRLEVPTASLNFSLTRRMAERAAIAGVGAEKLGEQLAIAREAGAELRDAIGETSPISGGRSADIVAQTEAPQPMGQPGLLPCLGRNGSSLSAPQKAAQGLARDGIVELRTSTNQRRKGLAQQMVGTRNEAEVNEQPRMLSERATQDLLQETARIFSPLLTETIDELRRA